MKRREMNQDEEEDHSVKAKKIDETETKVKPLETKDISVVSTANATIDPRTGASEEKHPNQDRIKTKSGEEIYSKSGLKLTDGRKRALESIIVVCDGHGEKGGEAATYFSIKILDRLEKRFFEFEQKQAPDHLVTSDDFKSAAEEIITAVFVEADDAFRSELTINQSGKDFKKCRMVKSMNRRNNRLK
eukprot:TRINITY_DN1859_c0_g1_i1.p1 TRINITY_DN1859_c0_g1~~TRINITY_DN1859_c0_g1_i1.p1  ORF type:complete len:188 (+),score=51.17 TRINITY_DN1859_c0_g1_i1:63-626(+)